MAYDYSKVGDKNVQIRNLDTDEVFTYYQADVGALPMQLSTFGARTTSASLQEPRMERRQITQIM